MKTLFLIALAASLSACMPPKDGATDSSVVSVAKLYDADGVQCYITKDALGVINQSSLSCVAKGDK